MRISAAQRMILIIGLLLLAGVLHVSHCRWRFGSSGADVAIIGSPGPVIGSPVFYGSSDPNNMNAWQGTSSIFYAASQPQYGLFSRYGILSGTIIGVALPLILLTITAMIACTLRQTRRLERGTCPRCGYDLRFNYTTRCSECGWMKI